MKLFDNAGYDRLMREFERSTRGLLEDLCRQLDAQRAHTLDTALLRKVGAALPLTAFSSWKAVGWVEELNDCVYFLDAARRLAGAGKRQQQATAQDIFLECQEQFYENSYFVMVFPSGNANPAGLIKRLTALAARLGDQVTQEALLLAPQLVTRLVQSPRAVRLDLAPQFERVEPKGVLGVGLDGAVLVPPARLRSDVARLELAPGRATYSVGKGKAVLALEDQPIPASGWRLDPVRLVEGYPHFSVGPALLFGKDKTPSAVVPAPANAEPKIQRALAIIQHVWPQGFHNLERFTTRIIPIKARGVVSFSYRNRPQLSFINCYDRNQLDMVDDLIHENAHHHLNLLLRKYELRQGDHNQEIFYSPWRRSLRPIHGILHASFTFTMGARLFERISTAAGTRGLPAHLGVPAADVARARFRCLEEVASVQYSLEDLRVAARKLGFMTRHGKTLVELLAAELEDVENNIRRWRPSVLKGPHAKAYQKHLHTLAHARGHYQLKIP